MTDAEIIYLLRRWADQLSARTNPFSFDRIGARFLRDAAAEIERRVRRGH